jgi:ferric-dicitrate binding protein FerR (iron transport regulator)
MSRDPSAPIESLLKLAGERDRPSAAGTARAREAARESWARALEVTSASSASRARRRWPFVLAAAAVLVVVAFAWPWWRMTAPAGIVASVAHVEGDVRLTGGGGRLEAAGTLRSGDTLITGEGLVALTLGDTLSLRVGRSSRLRFDRDGHVTLIEGAVYVDSGGLQPGAALRIATPVGEVRHVGTQFQVQVRERLTRVQVREGRVVMTMKGASPLDLAAGDLAETDGRALRLERGVASFGAEWEWAAMTGMVFDIENRPLSELLAWLAREHGWQLRHADTSLVARVQEIRLHGSMRGLDGRAMIERATWVTGVPLSVREGILWVGEPSP